MEGQRTEGRAVCAWRHYLSHASARTLGALYLTHYSTVGPFSLGAASSSLSTPGDNIYVTQHLQNKAAWRATYRAHYRHGSKAICHHLHRISYGGRGKTAAWASPLPRRAA